MENLETTLTAWTEYVQDLVDRHLAEHNYNWTETISVQRGRRYAKFVITADHGSSVHHFVDLTNGDILKAKSWKAPAKHARGNIFDSETWADAVTVYGGAYLR